MNKKGFVINDINEYINFISQVKNLSDNTANSYLRDLKKFSDFVERLNISKYSEITDDICSAWIGDLFSKKINPRSIQRHISSAKGFFKFLKKNNVVNSSPFELITAPKIPNNLPEVLSPEDVEQLLKFKPTSVLSLIHI